MLPHVKSSIESETTEIETETESVTETVFPDEVTYDERNYQFEHKMDEPSSTIHNIEDFKKHGNPLSF